MKYNLSCWLAKIVILNLGFLLVQARGMYKCKKEERGEWSRKRFRMSRELGSTLWSLRKIDRNRE